MESVGDRTVSPLSSGPTVILTKSGLRSSPYFTGGRVEKGRAVGDVKGKRLFGVAGDGKTPCKGGKVESSVLLQLKESQCVLSPAQPRGL